MNDDERNDQREDQGIFNKLKKGHKKGNKSIFKMMLKKAITIILPVLLKIMVPLIILVCVWSAITHILDIRGSTDIVDVASSAIINENSEIVKAEDGEGYYFKIKNTIVEDFLEELNRAYYEGHYFDHIDLGFSNRDDEDLNTNSSDFVYDKDEADIKEDDVIDWFGTEDYEEYLIKLIRAEIASSYPKLGDYQGKNRTEDKQGNKKDSNRRLCCARSCRNSKD